MKIKWGALVVDGRGKIGGHVASKNRGGAYMRTKVTPVNPQSAQQSAVRQLFGQLSQSWSTLTPEQRASFDEGVSDYQQTNIFGDLKSPSGKALFQRLNTNLLTVGASQVNTLPSLVAGPTLYPSAVQIDTGLSSVFFDQFETGAGIYGIVRSSGKVTAGTTFVKNKMRVTSAFVLDGATLPQDFYSGYTTKFGVPTSGDKIYFEFNYVLSNGVQTPRIKMLATFV